jgi:hypothetical protein
MGRSSPVTDEQIYTSLAREFEHTFSDTRGGVNLTYITGEQATTRLNEVLGYDGWSFEIISSEVVEDEVLVLGELTVWSRGESDSNALSVSRQQYGSQKIKRKRDSGTILDIGFDYKGAATDALKKCASLIGVGLYLSRKEEQNIASVRGVAQAIAARSSQAPPTQWDTDGNVVGGTPTCEVCGEEITDRKRKDGSIWFASEVAEYSRKTCNGRVLCYEHSRNAG